MRIRALEETMEFLRIVAIAVAVFIGWASGNPLSAHVIESVGRCNLGGHYYWIDVGGDFAYLTSYDSGLVVVNCSDPAHPVKIASLPINGQPQGVAVKGDYALIANEQQRVDVVDISNPFAPSLLSSIDSLCHAKEIAVDSLAYVAYCQSGVRVLDITDPSNPVYLSTFNTRGHPRDICARNGILCVADDDGGFVTIDAGDPYHPALLDTLQMPNHTAHLRIHDDFAYLIDTYSGLVIIDISDPSNVTRISSTYVPGPYGCDAFDNFAVVSRGGTGLRIYNISNPASPVLIDSINTYGVASEVLIKDGYVYVADESYLQIFRFIPSSSDEAAVKPRIAALPQNYPNPFNALTTISYTTRKESLVTVKFFDISGKMVETIPLGGQTAGRHTLLWNAEGLSSGMYFYKIEAGDVCEMQKCLLIK